MQMSAGTYDAKEMYTNTLAMQGNTKFVLVTGEYASAHNGCYIIVNKISDVGYTTAASDQHDYVIDAVGYHGDVTADDVHPGMRFNHAHKTGCTRLTAPGFIISPLTAAFEGISTVDPTGGEMPRTESRLIHCYSQEPVSLSPHMPHNCIA